LHFAGEHACYKFVGYMEGALNSGVAVAKRIAARDAGATVPPARELAPTRRG
jgi:monoamine oxidase